jgi:hypothetical protein
VDDAALATLCRRAGASLRFLDIRAGACGGITRAGLEAALQGVDRSMLELHEEHISALELEHEDRMRCYVCVDARSDTLFFACGHTLCAGCGAQLARCPKCYDGRKRDRPLRIL